MKIILGDDAVQIYYPGRSRVRQGVLGGRLEALAHWRKDELIIQEKNEFGELVQSLSLNREGRLSVLVSLDDRRLREPLLLLSVFHRSGAIQGRRMTDQSVLSILDRIRRKAKVRPFSPHDLRRSFISGLLDRGADIVTVQGMAGHANITTTARYDRRGRRREGGRPSCYMSRLGGEVG